MTYTVLDNFLSTEEFNILKDVMTSDWFPWYKINFKNNPYTVMDPEIEKFNVQFIHTFYKESRSWSEFFQYLDPIIKKISPLSIIRIKANMNLATNNIVKYDLHQDFSDERITTAIYYLNTNNGYTYFSDGSKIESKENRLVYFNSKVLHSGTTCTDEKFRCVLNLNFIK